MAITINGSGSITGISAGGLPDGSVTAADLASGAITSGALPSGSVLQVVDATSTVADDTVITTGGNVFFQTATVNITPKAANSKFIITGAFSFYTSLTQNYQNARLWIRRDSTNLQSYFSHYTGSQAGNNWYFPVTHTIIDDPSYTLGGTLSYEIGVCPQKGSGSVGYPTVYIKNQAEMGFNKIIVQEIAA
jgi:hypothetical protein